jgi:hypothetical protein
MSPRLDFLKGNRPFAKSPQWHCVELEGLWDQLTEFADDNDDIHLLLRADLDGSLSPKDCARVAVRLTQIATQWSDDNHHKARALLLADNMLECARDNVPLKFWL